MEIAFEIFPPLTRTEECWKIKFNKKKERIHKKRNERKQAYKAFRISLKTWIKKVFG